MARVDYSSNIVTGLVEQETLTKRIFVAMVNFEIHNFQEKKPHNEFAHKNASHNILQNFVGGSKFILRL